MRPLEPKPEPVAGSVIPEMREAGARKICAGGDHWTAWEQDAENAYLAMKPLDPEVAELREKVAAWTAPAASTEFEEAEVSAAAFLTSQGYTRQEDGTWVGVHMGIIPELVQKMYGLEAQLAALRPVVDAAVAWDKGIIRQIRQIGISCDEVEAPGSRATLRAAVRAYQESQNAG
jgi:hypothetical protein